MKAATLYRQLLQLVLWGGYFFLNLALASQWMSLTSGMLTIFVLLSLGLWSATELLRHWVINRGWLDLSGSALALRLLLAVLLLPMLLHGLIFLAVTLGMQLEWIRMPGDQADYRPASVLMYWFNTVVLMALWTGGWIGAVALRRYRQGEIARLRSEAERSTLEFDALRARLNPHFVFNALNNVRALINEDPQRARELVTRLSNTLRHALDHAGGDEVSLEQERQVVEDYLAVEQVHFEDRLRLDWQLQDDALSARLPPMLLQLLVENAIKHGIARTPGGGTLQIAGELDQGCLRLRVSNPGSLDAGAPGNGVGLHYLRNRIGNSQPAGRFQLRQQGTQVEAVLEIAQ